MTGHVGESGPIRVIIDCDPGNGVPAADIDDGLAIALALASPEIQLEAITVVSGNTHRNIGFSVARTMLDSVGVAVPVYAGAAQALVEPSEPWRVRQDANSTRADVIEAWENVEPPAEYDLQSSLGAAEQIASRVCASPGGITIVAIGPLTNIANAIQIAPDLPDKVKRIVIMGGAFDVPGFLQELNFGIDPEAAHIVLTSGAPITLVPLDVTSRTLFRHSDLDRLAGVDGNPLAAYVLETTRPWIDYAAAWRKIEGCLLHDPLTVALILEPDICEYSDALVDVELRGTLTRGRPIMWTSENLRLHVGLAVPELTTVRVATNVDNARLVELLIRRISAWSS